VQVALLGGHAAHSIMPEAPLGFSHVMTIMVAERLSEGMGSLLVRRARSVEDLFHEEVHRRRASLKLLRRGFDEERVSRPCPAGPSVCSSKEPGAASTPRRTAHS